MEKREEKSLFKKIGRNIRKTLDDLKEDSVGHNPTKPVDCCNPDLPPKKTDDSIGKSSSR